ncbi:MAG TPA: Ig-like domain-containing protein, partial [Cyclobacteriaceae bacterium]|nr:Ig-like domain-containing protein [Cyclobacteriaceae bacterium]
MWLVRFFICFIIIASILSGCKDDPEPGALRLVQAYVGSVALDVESSSTAEVPVGMNISLTFSTPINPSTASAITLTQSAGPVNATVDFISGNKTAIIAPLGILDNATTYTISISNELRGANGASFSPMQFSFKTIAGNLTIESWKIGDLVIVNNNRVLNVSRTPVIEIDFSVPLNPATVTTASVRITGSTPVTTSVSLQNENKKMVITTAGALAHLRGYTLSISNALRGAEGQLFAGLSRQFFTEVDV